MARTYGSCCDRCGGVYLAISFPNIALCPDCYLGSLDAQERGRLLGYIEKTGRQIAS